MTGSSGGAAARWVVCPSCRTKTIYSIDNPARPFCSERCRRIDLGAWASEDYRVAATPPETPDEDAAPPAAPH